MVSAVLPAQAQKAPDAFTQEVLIKTTLLTFNDANVTGNYAVLHAKLSKPFRDKFSPERLAEVFKVFRDKKIDFDLIAAKPPIAERACAGQRQRRADAVRPFRHDAAARVNYELEFIMSDGEWKPIRIEVQLKPVK